MRRCFLSCPGCYRYTDGTEETLAPPCRRSARQEALYLHPLQDSALEATHTRGGALGSFPGGSLLASARLL